MSPYFHFEGLMRLEDALLQVRTVPVNGYGIQRGTHVPLLLPYFLGDFSHEMYLHFPAKCKTRS